MCYPFFMKFLSKTQADTAVLAKNLLPRMRKHKLVLLSGALGSGKTTFVKGVAKALGIKKLIKSPTYTYLNVHPGFFHFDLYRLPEAGFLHELEEALHQKDALIFVEWPEKSSSLFSYPHILITFKKSDSYHDITVSNA